MVMDIELCNCGKKATYFYNGKDYCEDCVDKHLESENKKTKSLEKTRNLSTLNSIENDIQVALENCACLGRDAYGDYIDKLKRGLMQSIKKLNQ